VSLSVQRVDRLLSPTPTSTGADQQLRCVDRAQRENDFKRGFGTTGLSAVVELNACCALSMDQNTRGQSTGRDSDVRLIHKRVQIGSEDRVPLTVANGHFHHAAIRVRKALQTDRLSTLQ
jgi:hypothetical protein